jgi:hypothetical protein
MGQTVVGVLVLVTSVAIALCVQLEGQGPQAGSSRGVSGGRPPTGLTAPNAPAIGFGTAAVSGDVVDAITHEPIEGAVVTLTDRGLGPAPALRMLTDSKGRFVFSKLPASNRYELTAARLGYFDGGLGQTLNQPAVATLVLAERQWKSDARVELWRPGALTGFITDDLGDPVVGASVRALREIQVGGHVQYATGPAIETDDRGAYRLANLSAGRYVVFVPSVQMTVPTATPLTTLARLSPSQIAAWEASGKGVPGYTEPGLNVDSDNRLVLGTYLPPPASGGRAMAFAPAYYPDASSVARAAAVELLPGMDKAGVDFRLNPVPTSRLSGVLQGPPEVVSKFTLRLVALGNEGLGRGSETATTLVDGSGRFTFLNVPVGDYVIDARGTTIEYTTEGSSQSAPLSPGLITSWSGGFPVNVGPPGTGVRTHSQTAGDRYWARLNVTADGRDVNDLVVVLRPTVALEGRYVYVGRSQPPNPPWFPIRVEPANGDPALGGPSENLLRDQDGVFRFEGLLPGEYLIRAPGSGSNPWVVKSVMSGGVDHANTPFNASLEHDIEGIVITFTDDSSTLTGSVHDAAGAAVQRAAVIVFPVDRTRWANYGLRPDRIKTTRLTNAGTYSLRLFPADEYFVIAVDEAQELRWQDPAFLEAATRTAVRVSLAWGETKTVNAALVIVR